MKKVVLLIVLIIILFPGLAFGQTYPEKPLVIVQASDSDLARSVATIPTINYRFISNDIISSSTGYNWDYLLSVESKSISTGQTGINVNGNSYYQDNEKYIYTIQWINRDGVVMSTETISGKNIRGRNFTATISINNNHISFSSNKQSYEQYDELIKYIACWKPNEYPIIPPTKLSDNDWNRYCPQIGQEWLLYYGNDLQIAKLDVLQVLPDRKIKFKYKRVDYNCPFSLRGTTVHILQKSQE